MPGRDRYADRNREWEARDRRRRELEGDPGPGRGEDRAFGRFNSDGRRDGPQARQAWRDGRAEAPFDQDRTGHGGGRGGWQDRDWRGGSPGLSDDFDARASQDFGYGGQEFGIEASRRLGRSPEPPQRMTDGEDGRSLSDRFGGDGRPEPHFETRAGREFGVPADHGFHPNDDEFEPHYTHWRDEQLRKHDDAYRRWRADQRKQYDDDYRTWRSERRTSFGQTFSQWRDERAQAKLRPAGADETEPKGEE